MTQVRVKKFPRVITYSSCHQDGTASRTELMQSVFSVSLRSISVNAGAGIAFMVKEVFQCVGSLLGLHEHQCQRFFTYAARGRTARGENWVEGYRPI